MEAAVAPRPDEAGPRLLAAATVGALVAVALGIYGNAHDPASDLSITLGFSDTITMKVWLASAAALLAVTQVLSASWMYGKLPLGDAPGWIGGAARITRRLGVLLRLPGPFPLLFPPPFPTPSARGVAHLPV